MPRPLRALAAVLQPDGIYVIGGYDGENYVSDVSRYELLSKKWKKMPKMSQPRGTFVAIPSRNLNYIYAIGGFNGEPLS